MRRKSGILENRLDRKRASGYVGCMFQHPFL
jgi:hypothetical protein